NERTFDLYTPPLSTNLENGVDRYAQAPSATAPHALAGESATGRIAPVLLSVQHLVCEYPTRAGLMRAVDDVSFDIRAGESMGLVGESGSGKSTLCKAIMRLI